jgi:hypothetical protein
MPMKSSQLAALVDRARLKAPPVVSRSGAKSDPIRQPVEIAEAGSSGYCAESD